MPKKSQLPSMTLDLSHLSNAVKKVKGYKAAPTSPLGSAQSSSNPTLDLEVGSAMVKKSKKDPMVSAEERIVKAIDKAIEAAEMQINRKLISAVLKERIRGVINQRFHGKLSPADIDRFSSDAARGATYELNDLKVIPEAFTPIVVVDTEKKENSPHTEEPDADVGHDD